jgi:hypothetical protein
VEKLNGPAEASSHQSTQTLQGQLKKLTVLNGMKVLFSAYRLDQYTDPDGFKLNIGLVLEQYPIETIKFVTDPRTGVQRRHEWPPSVKNVVDACDSHMGQAAMQHRFRNWGKGNDLMLEGPRETRLTREELKAKYGDDWGLVTTQERVSTVSKPAPSWDNIAEMYSNDTSACERLGNTIFKKTVDGA